MQGGKALGGRGDFITRAVGKSHLELTFTHDCTECYLGMCVGGLVSVQGLCRLLGHSKWMQQYQGVVKLNSQHFLNNTNRYEIISEIY